MKLLQSFRYAFAGIAFCLSSEINFRIHVVAAIVAAAAGIYFKVSAGEWLLLLWCITFVLVTEMLNTALEKMCDVVHAAFHPVIKQIKDVAAGATVLTVLASIICGAVIFLPKIFTQ